MVKLVSFILLGFAACMVAALPSAEDSNGHIRIKRLSYPAESRGGSLTSVQVPHGDHVDQIDINADGSITKTHNHGPHYNNYDQRYGFNGGVNPGINRGVNPVFNAGVNPGFNVGVNPSYNGGVNRYDSLRPNVGYSPNHNHQHSHFPGEASIEITELSQDGFGHDIVKQTQVYGDGHAHSQTRHI